MQSASVAERILSVCVVLAAAGLLAAEKAPLFTLDFAKEKGHVRRLNGMCNTAKINNICNPTADALPDFKELEIPITHYHDDALVNPGYALVDVSRIFPLFRADENDPRNYDFGPTDMYVKRTLEIGSEIQYRLGESIEHCGCPFRARPPADREKWTRICLNIIRHYNEGWADGYHYNIRRWVIWEEPNGPKTFASENSFEDYTALYATVAPAIKRAFPDVLVGGPTVSGWCEWADDFVKFCRDRKLPLDFFTWDQYTDSPEEIADRVVDFRKMLDSFGFGKSGMHIAEWHLRPKNWHVLQGAWTPEMKQMEEDRLTGVDAAALASGTLSYLQDFPIDGMTYYNAVGPNWGVMSGRGREKRPSWYVFKAFALLAAKGEAVRIDVPSKPCPGTYLLASVHGGKGYLLVTRFFNAEDFTFAVAGRAVPARISVIDATRNLEEADVMTGNWLWDGDARTISVVPSAGCASSIWFCEFDLSGNSAVPPSRCVVRRKPKGAAENGN